MVGVEELEPRVTPSNTPPVAVNDSYSLHQGQTLNVVAIEGVLDNDSDAENDPLTAESVSDTSHGYLSIISEGSFTYTPNSGFVGTDSFTYRADDGTDLSNIATVTVTVTNTAPTATDDSYSVHQGQTLNVLNTPGVLANDADLDDDVLSAVQISTTSHGYLAFYSDGTFDYSPDAGYVGSDSFSYQAFDGAEYSATKTVSITVTNLAPSAAGQSYDALQDQALNISAAAGVLADDSDFDGDSLTASLVSDTSHGYLSLISDGSFTYNPDTGYSGLDSFTYRVYDGAEYSDTVTVWISVAPDDTPLFAFSSASYIVSENGSSATITVTLSRVYDLSLTVDYATSDGTATAGSDYTAASGTLTFVAGVTSQTFTVPITSDSTAEPDETVLLALTNPGGGAELVDLDAAVLNIVAAVPPVITVNSTGDGDSRDGVVTLHEATLIANGTLALNSLTVAELVQITGLPGANQTDEIRFNIAGNGPYVINLTQALPTITDAVVIDGGTQPGFVGTPVIELNGAGAGAGVDGLVITAGNSVIRSLVIREFAGEGIFLHLGGNNRIENNYIGTDVTGTLDKGNGQNGVRITDSADNVIGGGAAETGNLISGNEASGVVVEGAAAARNVIARNLIGVDLTSSAALGNTRQGVLLQLGATSNTIGGAITTHSNLIAANGMHGIRIINQGTASNKIVGNWIGDTPEVADLGNGRSGVQISLGATLNEIGISTLDGTYNVIAGNGGDGVHIERAATKQNKIRANFIGLYSDGTTTDGNAGNGIFIEESPDNVVGGTAANGAERNIISGNTLNGIAIVGVASVRNKLRGNYIGTNAAATADRGNLKDGIRIEGAGNTIVGGSTAEERNVISGNDENGIALTSYTDDGVIYRAKNTWITGNYVGTDGAGTVDLGNSKDGVLVDTALNTFIGFDLEGHRNVISGNNSDGIDVRSSTNTKVRQNYIGVDATGLVALGNEMTGVSFTACNLIVIGSQDARNVISGNKDVGILIDYSTNTKIQTNYVGLDMGGNTALGNGKGGIRIAGSVTRNTLIGGLRPVDQNVISGNLGVGADATLGHGIAILGGIGTTVQGNYIGTDRTGLVALGNSRNGIYIQGNSPGNLIGGAAQNARNVIAASGLGAPPLMKVYGVEIVGSGNTVEGNLIGRDANGDLFAAFLNKTGGISWGGNEEKNNTGQK